jgi:hypothetical protein
LIGIWVIAHYSGHPVSAPKLFTFAVLLLLLSGPILNARHARAQQANVSTIEQDSRIAGYGVLDASLAVQQEPSEIHTKLTEPQRWLDLPAYLVPSAVWHGRPNINPQRMDYIVAQAIGTQNDKATGFPTTYLIEAWLYAGWLGVLLASVVFGGVLGWLHRRLVGMSSRGPSYAALLSYCFVVTVAFSYYENGDLLSIIVGNTRAVLYLGVCLLITGVWARDRKPARDANADRMASPSLLSGDSAIGIAPVTTSSYQRYRSA